MNRRLLIFSGIFLFSPIVLLIVLWFLVVKPAAQNHINSTIKESNIPISGNPLKIFFLGLKSSSTLTINTKPVPIPLEQPVLKLSPLSILTLNPRISLDSDLFGGKFSALLGYKISDGSVTTEINAENLQIVKCQIMSMLGFTSGNINLQIGAKGSSNGDLIPTKLFFMLKGLKKPYASKVPEFISPLQIKVPSIENGDLVVGASCSAIECKSSRLSFTSNLGEASGSFNIDLTKDAQIQSAITVSLTQYGRTELLPYFGLLNQNLLSTPDKPFVIKISGNIDRPKLAVSTIQ